MSESFMPSSLPSLCAVLTMPVVTVFCRAKGLPMATTNSPGLRSAELPRDSTRSFFCYNKHKKKPLKKYQHTGENTSMSEQHRWKEEKTFRGRGIVESLQNSPGISDRGVRLHTSALCLWLTELVFMKVLLMSSRKLSDVDKEMCQDVGCVVYVGSFKIYGCKKI